jgi:flagellar hook-associated protein 2
LIKEMSQMKKNFIAISALAAALIASTVAHAQSNPAAGVLGVVQVGNSISGSVNMVNGGSSESKAINTQTASANLNAVTSTNVNAAAAGFTGVTQTTGAGQAWNYATGSGTGTANSNGLAAAGVAGAANIANIGITGIPGQAQAGVPGDLAGAGALSVKTQDAINASTNQGGVTATSSSGSLSVALGASTVGGPITTALNDNSNVVNGVALTSSHTADLSVSGASGSVNLNTGVDADGKAVTTTLGNATTNTNGNGNFTASASGGAAVATVGGTVNGIVQAINPAAAEVIKSDAISTLGANL